MYVCKETGLTEYETFDELLNAEIIEFTEDRNSYYIILKPEQPFDCTVWVVDKKTEKVAFTHYIQYAINTLDNVTPVDPAKIKRVG